MAIGLESIDFYHHPSPQLLLHFKYANFLPPPITFFITIQLNYISATEDIFRERSGNHYLI